MREAFLVVGEPEVPDVTSIKQNGCLAQQAVCASLTSMLATQAWM